VRADSIRVSAIERAEVAPVWTEWGRLTRFLESAQPAFVRERNLWRSLELASAVGARGFATATS
jgi:hypothetical protein